MLLMAQDDEDKGRGMTDRQVRDEAMTIFLAGHETTANALTWTWYLLSQSPDIERRLHEEIDRVLAGRLPTVADVDRLPYTTRVVTESMRLYPPAWLVGRRAVNEHQHRRLFTSPPRSIVVMSQWIVHRDPRHYPEPERFDPDRWTPAFKARAATLRLLSFRRRTAPVHRRIVRVDGAGPGPRHDCAALEVRPGARSSGRRRNAAVTLRPKHGMKMTARQAWLVVRRIRG